MSNLQTRDASIGVGFEKPKLLIFPFLVRTNNEGVSALFCLAGDAGLPETVGRAGLDFRPIGDQSGTILVPFS